MRYILPFLYIIVAVANASGQDQNGIREGRISFITTQNIYVRFNSLEQINAGDTLFMKQGNIYIPALQITNTSSISCVCTPLMAKEFNISDTVYAKLKSLVITDTIHETLLIDTFRTAEAQEIDSLTIKSSEQKVLKQEISGRLSVSSYSNIYSNKSAMTQRMRYTFSMRANNLGNSRFSTESYISFIHSNTNWEEIKKNIFNGLKIYNLSIIYDFNETMQISAGRKINPGLSSVGAIDGFQFEKVFGSLTLGAVAGSRPDYQDYGINLDLLQYGIYLGHDFVRERGSMQNSLAFIEQTNQSETDRRFLYFQHTGWLMKKLNLFASGEIDLYKKVGESKETTFNLSNIYMSLRYKIVRQLSLGLSYNSRQNIIYYETYKDFVEKLLETESIKGWRFQINSQPVKNLVLGVSAGYRYRKEDPQPSKNVSGYATYRQVPFINAALTLSTNWLETSYLNGNIYSLGLTRDLISGKLTGGMQYRYVDYLYQESDLTLVQHILETNLSWTIFSKLLLSIYYEGSFAAKPSYNRIYINITRRF